MNILVIRFSSLGDIVLVTPLFSKIKYLYPSSHIDFLTDIRFSPIIKNNPNIENIIEYDRTKENINYFLTFLNKIRQKRYDIIIDCHRNPRSVLFLILGNTCNRKVVKKYTIQRREMVRFHKRINIPHAVERCLGVLDGNNKITFKPKIYLKNEEIDLSKNMLNSKRGSKKVVGFVTSASKATKMWKLEKQKKLAKILTEEKNIYIVFFGSESDTTYVNHITDELKDNYLDLTGKTNLRELAYFIEECDLLFTTDSGPMHIAIAVETPVIALFGPTVPHFGFFPFDEESVIISKSLDCRPCSLHGTNTCPLGHHNCMEFIEVDEVVKEIEKMLQKKSNKNG